MGYLKSTIGRKQLVGIAGLGLSLFVLMHMAGNLLIFLGPEAYNNYAHTLTSSPLIYAAEAGLMAMFLGHVVFAIGLTLYNKAAKGGSYKGKAKRTKASYTSKTMWFQGIVILAFLVWHLITFKYGAYYEVQYADTTMRDLYRLIIEFFQNPLYVVFYFIVLVLLGTHLSHGFASSVQTLGINGGKCDQKAKVAGNIYAALVTIGFLSQPFYVFFIHSN